MPDLRALVVDDEGPARSAMRHRLAASDGVEVVGEASSGREATRAIRELSPDVVFLDIEMSDGDGFDVVEELDAGDAPPAVVFVTAYDQYAVDAFEARALDYVLKPVSRERLAEVLARVRRRLRVEDDAREHRRLLDFLRSREADGDRRSDAGRPEPDAGDGAGPPDRLVVKGGGAYRLVPVESIDWLEAAGNYVRVHAGDRSHLHRISLTELEERLPSRRFARVHRSAIVNLDRVDRVVPNPSGDFEVHLVTGDVVKLSRSYRDRILT